VIWRSNAGGAWMPDAMPGPPAVLTGVWGSSDQQVFAVGHMSSVSASPIIIRYDGSAWSALTSCATSSAPCIDPAADMMNISLGGVSGRSANDIYAVGDSGTVIHFDGMKWSIDPTPSNTPTLDGVAPGSGEAFAVGSATILRKSTD
jgi:hypothetical protein